MRKQIEGSRAVAEGVRLCRPQVVCAYPITPQTHIVEELASIVADGELAAEFLNVESEFAAASVCLGASAAGARSYTATSSQGLLLMTEVLFNIAGLRLPMVLTCANRAISAPINIWNDHQDAMAVRDAGWIQFHAEDNQEALDLHIQAFRIAEATSLPVMVNMDGFILTHAFEPVDVPEQAQVDAFLPPYRPSEPLDPRQPRTFGLLVEPDSYPEYRLGLNRALEGAEAAIREVDAAFRGTFGRGGGHPLVEAYRCEEADTFFLAMGSVCGTIKEAVDRLREGGRRVGAVRLRTYRPFPRQALRAALSTAARVAVVEKAFSPGGGGILAAEVRSALYDLPGRRPLIGSFVAGLGGHDITVDALEALVETIGEAEDPEFVDLSPERGRVAEAVR